MTIRPARALLARWRESLRARVFTRAVVVVISASVLGFAWCHLDLPARAAEATDAFESGDMITPPADIGRARTDTVTSRVTIAVLQAPDAGLLIYRPRVHTGPLPVVLWIHGGGYVSHSAADIGAYATLLSSRGYVVASLDYTLAPEARYPMQLRQANAALGYIERRIAGDGGDPTRVFVAGDSAGAQLASQLAAVQTDPRLAGEISLAPGIPAGHLRGVVLDCGLYDMSTVAATRFPGLQRFLAAYTGYTEWMAAPFIHELSTTAQVTSAYPPTFITDGDADHFASQSQQLADALHTQGVPTETLFWHGAGLGHEYQYDFRLPQAMVALNRTAAFLASNSR